jgi:deoxyribonuclease-4
MKLNLGYAISLPLHKHLTDYDIIQNIQSIKNLSKHFNSIQIMFNKTKLNDKELNDILNIIKNYKNIYVHASYQINIGSDLIPTKNDLFNIGFDILINEIIYANKINAKAVIVHLGKNVKKQYNNNHVYNNMIKFVIELFNKLDNLNIKTKLLFETPAGQGGEMCYDLQEFVDFILIFKDQSFYKNIGICIDTCHVFQAGYNLNDDKVIKNIHKIFKPIQNKIVVIHLNDSVKEYGMHIDRHEQIGKGKINVNKLIKFILPYKKIPLILETSPPYQSQVSLTFKSLSDLEVS